MSEDSGFQWDRDEGESDSSPLPSGPGPQMSDSKAMLEAKRQLAREGFVVKGFSEVIEDEELEEQYAEANEDFELEEETQADRTTAFLEQLQGPNAETRSVLEEAKIRLEKAKLYEMIMKADIFQDVDADPRAIAKVREEFNEFGKERLEVLLGMRQEKMTAIAEQAYYPAHELNEMEVLAIKDLAAKLTQGESLAAGSPRARIEQPQQQKPQGLRSLRSSAPTKSVPQQQQRTTRAPLVKERNQNQRAAPPTQIKKKNGEVKQVHEMNEQELRERSKQVRSAPKGVPVQRPLPMPDGDATWGGGAQAGDARGGGGGQNLTNLLAQALGATRVQDVGNGDD